MDRWSPSSDHQLQDLQLQAAALAASHGITAVHEMSMPHWHGDRELDVFLRHRARLPVDATPVVATMESRRSRSVST